MLSSVSYIRKMTRPGNTFKRYAPETVRNIVNEEVTIPGVSVLTGAPQRWEAVL